MFSRIIFFTIAFPLAVTLTQAQELESQKDRFSYTMGYQMGLSLLRGGAQFDLDYQIVVQGVQDALGQTDPQLSIEDMDNAVAEQQKVMEAEQQQDAVGNLARGEEFLAQNQEREGVTVTESGLQYEILEQGDGAKPTAADTVIVHYEGALIDGKVFDSSYTRPAPATMPLSGVIQGWQEGLQLMPVGSKYKLFIPAHLAYGERGAGDRIGPNQALVFVVELMEIK